jgi:hypothetical protein
MFEWIDSQNLRSRVTQHLRSALLTLFAVGALLTAAGRTRADDQPAVAAETASPEFEETWQVIYIGKTRVGYGRSAVTHRVSDGVERISTDTEINLAILRFGQSVKTKTIMQTEETPQGDLLEFQYEMQNPPAAPTRSSGRVDKDKLVVETETNGATATREVPWDDSLKSPAWQDRLLRENPLKPGEKRTLKTFDPQFGKANTITMQATAVKEVALLEGRKKKLLEVSVTQSIAPQIVTLEYVDVRGDALKSVVSLLNMTTYQVSKDEALKALSGEEVDLAVTTLVRTRAIKDARKTKSAVYRISIPNEDPQKILSKGPAQKMTSIDAHTVDLAVEAISPPDEAPAGDDRFPGKEFLEPNSYLQSDDPLVQEHAADAAGTEDDPWKAAQLMERWVSDKLKMKNFSTLLASAAEVAKELSGDCTEHAVLLAAMCRAREIPSRVAVGLVYVAEPPSFGGHMWTEVFVRGKWVPLDATLGRGGIAAEHIKFSDSSFSEEGDSSPLATFLPMVSVLGKMKIEVREVKYDK